jgi:hypothetical protein
LAGCLRVTVLDRAQELGDVAHHPSIVSAGRPLGYLRTCLTWVGRRTCVSSPSRTRRYLVRYFSRWVGVGLVLQVTGHEWVMKN